jgi:hypothetical protein
VGPYSGDDDDDMMMMMMMMAIGHYKWMFALLSNGRAGGCLDNSNPPCNVHSL